MRGMAFVVGDIVQTPYGKGSVREIRNNGRILVDVRGRALECRIAEITPVEERKRRARPSGKSSHHRAEEPSKPARPRHVPTEIDLHGLTVAEALARAEEALNDSLLANATELRFIHGRSGGHIRDALHRWLRRIESIGSFRVDPRNEGVTIVTL